MDKINKLTLPATIIIAAIILGGFYYISQLSKQNSIEKQQLVEQEAKALQLQRENDRQELLLRQKECDSLSDGVKEKWNNVMGVTYDEGLWKECVVTYTNTETGEVVTSPLRFMKTAK